MKRLRFFAERQYLGTQIAIFAGIDGAQGRFDAAKPVTFETLDEGLATPDPMLRISREDAQSLMDALWDAGLRPSEGTGSAGSLAATERHLKDMQTIAFKLLDKGPLNVGQE